MRGLRLGILRSVWLLLGVFLLRMALAPGAGAVDVGRSPHTAEDSRCGVAGQLFNNTGLGHAPAATTAPSSVFFGGHGTSMPLAGHDYFSGRWLGNLSAPVDGSFNFTVVTDGGVRLWVGDHLVLDAWATSEPLGAAGANGQPMTKYPPSFGAAANTLRSLLAVPLRADTPVLFRLEYFHMVAPEPVLQLSWVGNHTAEEVVPCSAFAPGLSPAQAEREAMRVRHANAGWGNWWMPNMLSVSLLPAGLTLSLGLAQHSTGATLPTTIVFRQNLPAQVSPGPHAYYDTAGSTDGRLYGEVTIKGWQGLDAVTVRATTLASASGAVGAGTWAGAGGGSTALADVAVVVNATGASAADFSLTLNPMMVWGRVGELAVDAGTATARAVMPGLPSVTVYATGAPATSTGNASMPQLSFGLGGGAAIVIASGSARSAAEVEPVLAAQRAAVQARATKYGDLGDVYDAMHTIVAWNTIWTPYEGRITPVSRGWDFGSGYAWFCWDQLFLSLMASFDNKELAYSNVIQLIKSRTVDGFVPNYSSGIIKSRDRTEPPIGVKVVSTIYAKYQELWLLELLYPDLLSWNTWLWEYRRHDKSNGLIVLGSDPNLPKQDGSNGLQDARYESGLDNSPMYDAPPVTFNYTTHHMQLYDVGFSSMYLMETQLLAKMAAQLGHTADQAELEARAKLTLTSITSLMWDDANSTFCNILTNSSRFYQRLTPTLYYPMLTGAATVEQAERMITAHMTNPREFCVGQQDKDPNCTYPLPSVAQNDPAFPDNNYWRGRIWGPLIQLVYWGLSHPTYAASPTVAGARKALCAQGKALLLKEWGQFRHVHENYNALTGEGGDVHFSDPFYHWGALTGFVSLLEEGFYAGVTGSP